MKTPLLLLGICAGLSGTAQTINLSDTISTGDATDYFVLDSNVTNLESVTGAGVTWDYSTIGGYSIPQNNNTVIDRSASTYADSYPAADYSEDFENSVKTFFSNDEAGSQVIVHGFVFSQGGNDFIVKYDDDQLISAKLPMEQGDTYDDPIEGTASAPYLGTVINVDITGDATVTADGSGTLVIGANSYPNVLRVKTTETASGTLFGATATINRKTFVYYDIANDNMPIFMHAEVGADVGGTLYGYNAVYSKFDITEGVGITEEDIKTVDLSVYPNPANGGYVTIKSEKGTNTLNILNSLGQTIRSINTPNTIEEIDLSNYNSGIYFVQAIKGDGTRTEKLIVK